jgi:hypothetical protein
MEELRFRDVFSLPILPTYRLWRSSRSVVRLCARLLGAAYQPRRLWCGALLPAGAVSKWLVVVARRCTWREPPPPRRQKWRRRWSVPRYRRTAPAHTLAAGWISDLTSSGMTFSSTASGLPGCWTGHGPRSFPIIFFSPPRDGASTIDHPNTPVARFACSRPGRTTRLPEGRVAYQDKSGFEYICVCVFLYISTWCLVGTCQYTHIETRGFTFRFFKTEYV